MKTLVTTLRFGDCEWFGKFVPNLESWCRRHGYELRVWDNPFTWSHYPCPKFCERDMLEEFLASEADRMIYLDADVWIHPEAPGFPAKHGICLTTDAHHLVHNAHFNGWCAALYGREFPLWEYVNAGVWAVTRDAAAKMLRSWEPPYVEYFQEQHFFNAVVCRAKEDRGLITARLHSRWNMWAGDKRPAWFQHFWAMEKDFNEAELLRLKP